MGRSVATDANGLATQTIAQAVGDAAEKIAHAGVDTARLDAQLLLGFVLGAGREVVFGYPERILTHAALEKFTNLVARRETREPVSQIVGQKEFWGRPFVVTKDTLAPRPDSETLIAAVVERLAEPKSGQNLKVLDLGTGTGCLLLTLLAEYPTACGTGVDISEAALAVARINARDLALDDRAELLEGNWCTYLPAESAFDVVVSNPPYISAKEWPDLPPEVAVHEPRMALEAGEDGLEAYHVLAPQIERVLTPDGIAVIEVGDGQAIEVADIFEASGLILNALCPDLAGVNRALVFCHNNKSTMP